MTRNRRFSLTGLFSRRNRRKLAASRRRPFRPLFETLEDRRLLTTLTVNSPLDNLTPGDNLVTLREAIIAANTDATTDLGDTASGADTIVFDPSLDGTPIVLSIADIREDAAAMGDLDITSEVVIQGNGVEVTTVNANGIDRVIHVIGTGKLTLERLTITGGDTVRDRGAGLAIDSGGMAEITDSTISDNSTRAAPGAGIHNEGNLMVARSTISGNTAGSDGGGINNQGTLTVRQSTISENYSSGDGGGLKNTSGTATITNSTISGNAGFGGGIANRSTLSVTNSTITENSQTYGGAGGISNSGGSATISNSIISNNSRSDLGGTFSGTHNLVGDGSGTGLSNTVSVLLRLPRLADNGGPTQTHALEPGSAAIDAGSNEHATEDGTPVSSGGASLTTDQRGENRFVGTVDIGAFEVQLAPPDSFVVTTEVDENDGTTNPGTGAGTSLREAIIAANADPVVNTITFDPSLDGTPILLTIAGTGENAAADGDLDITSEMVIQGNGTANTIIDAGYDIDTMTGGTGERVLDVLASGNLSLSDVTVTGGFGNPTPNFLGGGIQNTGTLSVMNSTISGNAAGNGGGIHQYLTGTSMISNSTISGNTSHNGGGFYQNGGTSTISNSNISGNSASGEGGGVSGYRSGQMTVTNSTISGNSALTGGGIFLFYTTLAITNSTVSGNFASGEVGYGYGGGGIDQLAATSTITNSTISENSSSSGGGVRVRYGTSTVNNSIIANNAAGGDIFSSNTTLSGSNNLIEDGSEIGSFANSIMGDPMLGPLQDNDGPTETHALLAGSPAIDAGDNALLPADEQDLDGDMDAGEPIPFDQRGTGFPRIIDAGGGAIVDIGAFEIEPLPDADLVITKTDSPDPVVAGNPLTYTITVMNNGPADANDVVVTDTLPAGVSNAMTNGCTEDPAGTPTCSLGTITAGNSKMFTITVDVDAGTTGTITNMASASSSTPLTNTGDDSVSIDTTVLAPPITVIVTKHADTDDGTCDADCSLREAVIATNAHVTPAGPNTILFDASLDGTPITLTLSGTDNTSALGDLDISGDLVIQGNGARNTIIDAGGAGGLGDRVIHILPGADVTIDGVAITGGDSNAQGAGIRNAGTLTLVESSVSGNDANTQGGGVFSNGTATIVSSLISGNTAGGRGGGLYGTDVTIANSTISGNTATGNGGGIYNDGNLTVANLTIASNSGASGGGIFNNGSLSIDNSIITLSTGGDCAGGGSASGSSNRSDDATCVGDLGAVTGFDAALADNGGATNTHALQPGSNAIDAGDNDLVPADAQDLDGDMDTDEPLFFDQRGLGFARIVDGGGGATVDIGAFELVPYTAQIVDDDVPIFSAGGFSYLASMSNPHGFAGPDGILDEYYSAANSGNMATWTFTVTPGVYRVSANWTPHANRATNSPFSVFDGPAVGLPVQTKAVNQELAPDDFTDGGAAWEDIFPNVTITGTTLTVKLSDTPANGFVIADGMRIERILGPEIAVRDVDGKKAVSGGDTVDLGFVVMGSTVTRDFRISNLASNDLDVSNVSVSPAGSAFSLNPDPNPLGAIGFDGSTDFTIELDTSAAGLQQATVTIASNDPTQPSFTFDVTATVGAKRIIDDGDAGFAGSKFTGFGAGFTGAPQGYQDDVHYHAPATPGFAAAKWIFGGLEPGTYQVSVTWNEHANRSNQSSFTISGTTSDGTVQVNQRQAPSSFAGAFTDEAADWAPLNVGGSGGNFTLSGSTLTVTLGTNAFGYVIADAVRIEKLSMLRAESAAAPGTDGSAAAAVRTADATALLDEAIAHWSSVDRAAAARLAGVSLQVADLPGDVLGLASAGQSRIWLDTDAAGHGWNMSRELRDESRESDDSDAHSGSRHSTLDSRLGIDLLSVVTHELGHVLGLPDLDHIEYPTNIMAGRLAAGTRRLPDLAPNERIDPIAAQRDWLFADFGRDEYSLESDVADRQVRDESQASVARRSSSTSRLTAQRMDDDADSLNIETRSSEQTEEDVLDAMFAALTEELDI